MSPLGHVTSSYFSPTLGHSIALALIAGGRNRRDQGLFAAMTGGTVPVTVTDPVFFDPKGERLDG